MAGVLLLNPRAGKGRTAVEELAREARARGIEVRLLGEGGDVATLARGTNEEPLGVAGGDGSVAAVAAVAVERGARLVCVPFGTRNHFARDLGLDRNDPVAALDAFSGLERRVDVGRVGPRLFLNNVSLGAYAQLVHRREQPRGLRRREVLAGARVLWATLADREQVTVSVDGRHMTAHVVLVANNHYQLDVLSLGERKRLDDGLLHLYAPTGVLPRSWEELTGTRFTIDARSHRVNAAVDGEPAELETPLEFRIEARALRVLVPPPRARIRP